MKEGAKRLKIIEAAKIRFARFGQSKTTMEDIAKDLSMSKSLLYYYFPDKNSIYLAVLKSIADELKERMDAVIERGGDIEQLLIKIIEVRIALIKENYNVVEFSHTLRNEISAEFESFYSEYLKKDQDTFIKVFEMGVKSGELMPIEDVRKIAKIYITANIGIRSSFLLDQGSLFIPPSKEKIDEITDYQKEFIKIFVRGMRATPAS